MPVDQRRRPARGAARGSRRAPRWRSRTITTVAAEDAFLLPVDPAAGWVPPAGADLAPDPVERFPFRVTDPAEPAHVAAPRDAEPDVAAVAPGPELAGLLTRVDPEAVTDLALVELVDAAVRLEAWAHAAAARYAAVLARRDAVQPVEPPPTPRAVPICVAAEELSLRLSWSRRAAQRLVRQGQGFDGALAATGEALARGDLDVVRAGVVADRLHDLPVPVALDVQDAVLPGARARTAAQLAADVERALIRVDPAEAAARRAHARTGRRVERPRPLPDGMASIRAVLAAPDATRVHATLEAAARTAHAAGDPRTLDQLRADGLTDLVLHTACDGGPGAAADAAPAAPVDSAPVDSAPDAERAGAACPGAGVVVDGVPLRGVTERDVAAVSPAARTAADPACPARRRPTTVVHVTVPLSTLLGLDDGPADLAGHGPVDAVTARALAAGGVWRRLVTDPLSGTLLDLGRTRYRPTAALAEHVRVRDRTCVWPTCTAPAASCDLDHTRDFHGRPDRGPDDPPGTTCAANLGPLCRHHHRVKSEGGLRLRQTAPGEFEWTTRLGRRYRVAPGRDPDPPAPPPAALASDDPPPF